MSLAIEDLNIHSTSKVKTFWGCKEILVGPQFKRLYEREDMILRLRLEVDLG